MSVRRWVLWCAFACASSGCYRTVYRNLEPPDGPFQAAPVTTSSTTWRSFFLYGWVPPELVVDAAAECGGATRVYEIRTRRTFVQGLVASFASSAGVNVYSPWTGDVVCTMPPLRVRR